MRNSYRNNSSKARPRRALTLAEVIVSSLLVGFLIVAALNATGSVFRMRFAAAEIVDGNLLAEELAAEIMQASYEDSTSPTFGLETGEGSSPRTDFDDVDDYDGWSTSPPQQKDGTPVPNATGWTRTVEVKRVTTSDPTVSIGNDKGLKRITVTVTAPSGRTYTYVTLRAAAGQLELKPPADSTYVTNATVTIQPTGGTSRRTGAAIANHAQDN